MKILIIQTAFLGDVILATSLLESVHKKFPGARIDFLLSKGNETLFNNHPFLNELFIFNKKKNKILGLIHLISTIRKNKYDLVLNLHRYASSGLITMFSGAKSKRGFDKNPFSFLYTKKFNHFISAKNNIHEIDRNHVLISDLTKETPLKPKLYPTEQDKEKILSILSTYSSKPEIYGQATPSIYLCIAPASVWFTKQFPKHKWIELISLINSSIIIFLLGSEQDVDLCEEIRSASQSFRNNSVLNLAGKLSLLQSAVLMQGAKMNYVNDSAPMHIASAMNAPVTAVFCSTVPGFGFGPLSDKANVIETKQTLSCRPCGLHGFRACPQHHFKCAEEISVIEIPC